MTATPAVAPGDVLAIHTGGWQGWWIRFGSAIRDQPNLSSHIAVAHHVDAKGTLWCVEGRPGGAGWRDATAYLKSPLLLTNSAQPKTAVQRAQVAKLMEALIGTTYDWEAIAADAATDLGWQLPGWDPTWHGTVPAHVVCSSLAAYAYEKADLARPAGQRGCQPSDWDSFIIRRGWELGARK
jgi:hypothetical protein